MDEFLKQISQYYTSKVKEFGTTSKGVDWNGEDSQFLRFYQLSKIFLDYSNRSKSESIIDFGCGYGAYIDFLSELKEEFSYLGIDISNEMISRAKMKYPNFNFSQSMNNIPIADYLVASGIFNVKQSVDSEEWTKFIHKTLLDMNKACKKGFSFNLLTSYSDKEYMRDYLYYANPMEIFAFCKENFSRNVAILHDYDLYEFTILVRK